MKNVKWLKTLRFLLIAAILADIAIVLFQVYTGTDAGRTAIIERALGWVLLLIPVLFFSLLSWLQIAVLAVLLPFLHYTLPQHDIVRVTNIDSRITSLGPENSWAYGSPDSGTAESTTSRDIRFIDAVFPDGKTVMVYRNEDTGWIWPPYFKYDSSTLQAEAGNLKSDAANPKWVVVTHYGWRLPILSIYPNAVSVREVDGPDAIIIPWVALIVIAFLIFGWVMLRRMWAQFLERSVEPVAAEMGETWDGVEARATGFVGRIKAWFGTWRRK